MVNKLNCFCGSEFRCYYQIARYVFGRIWYLFSQILTKCDIVSSFGDHDNKAKHK